jgi:hypothetical protein
MLHLAQEMLLASKIEIESAEVGLRLVSHWRNIAVNLVVDHSLKKKPKKNPHVKMNTETADIL